jgi:plastocyanin
MRTIPILAAALTLALAGCGSDDEEGGGGGSSGGGGGQTLALSSPADGALTFDKKELSASAGTVTIDYDNPSQTPHAIAIEGNGVDVKGETVTGGRSSASAELEAGEYTFYCPVGTHASAGMEGQLIVE